MKMKKITLAVVISGIWITASEFVRNVVMFKSYWLNKYSALGHPFPSSPINNLLWVAWCFFLAGCTVYLVRKLSFVGAVLITWILGFVMMWIVMWNLSVLPTGLLPVAAPWSFVEVIVAVLIARLLLKRRSK
ncbi:MAG: hypothetical protein U5R49_16520 [Deltaproteobacteria bacterium]|nr:hypothetical protein [Deltaproteobacteria bacterium]